MKVYQIGTNPAEPIKLKVYDERSALVQFNFRSGNCKVIVLNPQEDINLFKAQFESGIIERMELADKMNLYQALQESILNMELLSGNADKK